MNATEQKLYGLIIAQFLDRYSDRELKDAHGPIFDHLYISTFEDMVEILNALGYAMPLDPPPCRYSRRTIDPEIAPTKELPRSAPPLAFVLGVWLELAASHPLQPEDPLPVSSDAFLPSARHQMIVELLSSLQLAQPGNDAGAGFFRWSPALLQDYDARKHRDPAQS